MALVAILHVTIYKVQHQIQYGTNHYPYRLRKSVYERQNCSQETHVAIIRTVLHYLFKLLLRMLLGSNFAVRLERSMSLYQIKSVYDKELYDAMTQNIM